MVIDDVKAKTLVPILQENISAEATVYTDEAGQYRGLGAEFADHDFVRHSGGEYGRSPVHTNTIEGMKDVRLCKTDYAGDVPAARWWFRIKTAEDRIEFLWVEEIEDHDGEG